MDAIAAVSYGGVATGWLSGSWMRHLAASFEDLDKWKERPGTVVILETKGTGYAMTDDHPGAVILHGQGLSVANHARIARVRAAATVVY